MLFTWADTLTCCLIETHRMEGTWFVAHIMWIMGKSCSQINLDRRSHSTFRFIYNRYTALRCMIRTIFYWIVVASIQMAIRRCQSESILQFSLQSKVSSVQINLLQSIWHSNDIFISNTSSACLIHSFCSNKTFDCKCYDAHLFVNVKFPCKRSEHVVIKAIARFATMTTVDVKLKRKCKIWAVLCHAM